MGIPQMLRRIRAVYRNGTFCPETPCDLPENSEVDLLIQESNVRRPSVTDPDERIRILHRITDRMQNNPLPAGVLRYSRNELHERH